MNQILFKFRNTIIIFVALMAIYTFLLCVAFLPANTYLMGNYTHSVAVLDREGDYPSIFDSPASTLDNFTDKLMVNTVIKDESQSFFASAFSANEYARYWHGYLIYLRPLMLFLNYAQIRHLNIFLVFFLLCYSFLLMYTRIGSLEASSFLLAMCMSHIAIIPLSLQFMSTHIIMLIATLKLLLHFPNGKLKLRQLCYFFFIIGSVTNFLDLLTAPIITLGIPLTISYMLLEKKHDSIPDDSGVSKPKAKTLLKHESQGKKQFRANFYFALENSIFWGFGYAFTWIMKWVFGTAVLNQNVFLSASNAIQFRLMGNEHHPTTPLNALLANIRVMFPGFVLSIVLVLFIIGLGACAISATKSGGEKMQDYLPLILIALYPYIWTIVLSNHTQIHAFFTYRMQTVTIIALAFYFVRCSTSDSIKEKMHNILFR